MVGFLGRFNLEEKESQWSGGGRQKSAALVNHEIEEEAAGQNESESERIPQ